MRIAGALGWPKQATLKDLRHLFATSMANAGMPEPTRQYLLGHSSGRAAIHVYTHINHLPEQYEMIPGFIHRLTGALEGAE